MIALLWSLCVSWWPKWVPVEVFLGFLSTQSGFAKYNKMPQNFSSNSYHNTKLQLSDKNIWTHTRVKFKIMLWSKSKIRAFFVGFFPHTALYKKETKERGKFMHVLVRAMSCKPSVIFVQFDMEKNKHAVILDLLYNKTLYFNRVCVLIFLSVSCSLVLWYELNE